MMPGGREGEPITAEGMANVIAEQGWFPEPEARRLFTELSGRGDRLARVLRLNQPVAMTSSADAHASQVCRISSGVWASDT